MKTVQLNDAGYTADGKWRLVLVGPTPEMIAEMALNPAHDARFNEDFASQYAAAIAACPAPDLPDVDIDAMQRELEKMFASASNISESAVTLLTQRDALRIRVAELEKVLAELESQKPVGYFCRHPVLGFYEEQIGPSDSNIALYAQPVPAPTQVPAKPIIDKPTLPPGWQVSRVPDAEFQPRDLINICKYKPDGQPERGGTACRLDDSSLFWHFFNDWLLMQEGNQAGEEEHF